MTNRLIDLLFRLLFSLIFLALGAEHLFSDELIQKLMPAWFERPRLLSIASGIVLLTGGGLIAIGYQLRFAASLLIFFLIGATALVHGPYLFETPDFIHPQDGWLWTILQRSNYAKNLCLIGVCLMLLRYEPDRWSLKSWLERRR